ncbi:hypothetical protein [Patulibacter sp.]|uniref:hypothetical protein n=1 Tax=Patulibacter sp. TaxID=1912859 RepID=UPI0027258F57|nr:hypothetical protein [Patulibacter sp.]MDO9406917.1 hypothetical protein [Patulibacter sp.]
MPRPTTRPLVVLLTAALCALVGAAPAAAHQADPDYDSVLRGVTPSVPGLQVSILARGDEIAIANETGKTVEIPGYRKEPYLRMLPDGTVQENLRSQATFANRDPKGTTPIPASADASGPDSTPRWHTIDRSSRVEFHDHRIHWMGETGKPAPQVTDASKKQKVVDWQVPIVVGGTPADIGGTLYWTPQEAGFPLPAAIGLVAVLLVGGGLVLLVRRRRGPGAGTAEDVW